MKRILCAIMSPIHGRQQNFFPGVGKQGVGDESPPAGSRDGALGALGALGAKPQKTTTGCENNAYIIRLLSVLL